MTLNKIFLLLFVALLIFKTNSAQDLNPKYHKVVKDFIDLIKNNQQEKLFEQISFPFQRRYPLPPIKNSKDFSKRYHEVFDENLKTKILTSDISKDWADVGWRGIMLHNGILWIDYDGSLISINQQSRVEKAKKKKLIEIDKRSIHNSLQEFKNPILILETKKFKVRIDELNDGSFRYASWNIKANMSAKPNIILTDGEMIREGSGGNHRYIFKNRAYRYECVINYLGSADSPPAHLKVYKNEKEILSAPAHTLKD